MIGQENFDGRGINLKVAGVLIQVIGKQEFTSTTDFQSVDHNLRRTRPQTSDATGFIPVETGFCPTWISNFRCNLSSAKARKPPG